MQIHRHECMDTTGNSHVVILTVSVRADYKKKVRNYTRTHICLLCMAHSFIGLCVGAICGFLVAQKKLPSSTVALITFHEKEKGKVRSVKVWLGTKLQPAAYFILAQAFKDHHASLSGDLHPLPCLAHASCFSSPSLPLSFPVPFCFSSPFFPPPPSLCVSFSLSLHLCLM